jgi:alkylation response protein AidB-like acyl-CoA dehydrogenase
MGLWLSEAQLRLRDEVRKMMLERVAPQAAETDEKGEFPWEVKELFAASGLFRLVVQPEYGGTDGLLSTLCVAIEEVSRVCGASSMILGNQSLGASPLVLWGSEAQKKKYLPKVASGECLASFALTEANAGSDVAAVQTRAVLDGGSYSISGSKIFITHGNIADLLVVFAKVDAGGKDKLTAFLVERGTPGLSTGKLEKKMGLKGSSTAEIIFDQVRVPGENIVGKIGDGFRIALDCLDKGRVMVGAMATGLAQGALDAALAFARDAVSDGVPLAGSQAVQFTLADMETVIQASRSLTQAAAVKYDRKEEGYIKFSAMSKLFASDMVMDVTSKAADLLGDYGYSRDYPVERMMRDAKIFAIFEGTNQIQRLVIARELLGK